MKTRRGIWRRKKKNKKEEGKKGEGPSSPLPPPASPPPLTLLRVSSCAHACAASFVLGAEPQRLKKMGQSAPRTLLLLLAGLLGEALAGFPNTISIGKRPPRHRDPLLPPASRGEVVRGAARGEPGRPRQLSGVAPLRVLPAVTSERQKRCPGCAGGRPGAEPGAALSLLLGSGGRVWSALLRIRAPEQRKYCQGVAA